MTFLEDRCRIPAGARPIAALRNPVTSLIRRAGIAVPEARESFREDRSAAITLVTGAVL